MHTSNMQVSADVDNAIKNFLNDISSASDEKSNPHIFQRILNKISEAKA